MDKLNATFAALSDPTRRMILNRLALGPATVNELAQPFKITQQAISKHLAYLEHARLIGKKREGRKHVCSLKAQPIRAVADWAMGYRRFWEESYERLDDLLDELKAKENKQTAARKKQTALRGRRAMNKGIGEGGPA